MPCCFLPRGSTRAASIADIVTDACGAMLPGVTVEASSTALIEEVRTAVTNNSGQYRIEDQLSGFF